MTAFQKNELLHVTKAEILQLGVGMYWFRKFLLKLVEFGFLAPFFLLFSI